MKVYGSRPTRLDKRINRNRPARRRDHFCPFKDSWLVMFVRVVFRRRVMARVMRFPISWGLWWIRSRGSSIEIKLVGSVSSSGLSNC